MLTTRVLSTAIVFILASPALKTTGSRATAKRDADDVPHGGQPPGHGRKAEWSWHEVREDGCVLHRFECQRGCNPGAVRLSAWSGVMRLPARANSIARSA